MKKENIDSHNSRGTIFISGASRGIGGAIAVYLAEHGYDIWANYNSSHEAAREVQQKVERTGRRCVLLPFDVSNETQARESLEPLLEDVTPYGVVHNAGITRDTLLPMMKRQEWDDVINVHLNSFYILTRIFSRPMISARQGRIIAISSVSGETGQAGQVNYSAAKAGLVGGCKAPARELAKRKILVNVVSPGLIETDMTHGLPMEQMVKMVPLNRMGTCEEVAGVVRFLLSEEASYITGQVISVNGGLYM